MDALTALRTIALATSLSLRDALAVVDALGFPNSQVLDLSTLDSRVRFARTIPSVVSNIQQTRKIQAIKDLRQAASDKGLHLSLKESKDAVDQLALDLAPRW